VLPYIVTAAEEEQLQSFCRRSPSTRANNYVIDTTAALAGGRPDITVVDVQPMDVQLHEPHLQKGSSTKVR